MYEQTPKNAEREYYNHWFSKYISNLKRSWNIIKDIICKKKTSSSCPRFYISTKWTADKQHISDGFNSYIVNIGPSLADRISPSSSSPVDNMRDKITDCMLIQPVIESEVQTLIKHLNISSAGYDSITAAVVSACNKIVDHSDIVGASPVGAVPTTSSFST